MAALAQETAELAARVAEECKSLRTLINANSPDLSALNTSATNNLVAAVNEVWTITQSGIEWDNIQSKPSTFTPSAHVHSWSDITSGVPTSFVPSAHKTSHATGGSDELTAADIGAAPTSHTHTASQISDSTATGQSLMTAASASSARTTLGLGNAALATTSTGGNGSTDSGKVLAFGSNGEVRFAYFVLVGGSGTGTLSGTNLTGTRSYESPDANGTLALTASTTGIPDNLVVSSTKTTPVEADSVLMTDSEVAGTPAKRLSFANLWTWITTKLGGNLTIGGTKTWSGQQEATGQAATNGTSLMTRDLGDTRYGGQVYELRIAAQVTSNSTSNVTAPETLVLPAGTYEFYGNTFVSTASTTGGAQMEFLPSNLNADTTSARNIRSVSSGHGISSTAMTHISRVGSNLFQYIASSFVDGGASGKAAWSEYSGVVIFSVQQTISAVIRQRTTTDSSNPAILEPRSFIRFIKKS